MLIREDLPPGLQLAQAVHAAIELERKVETPPTVVVLGVEDEDALLDWADSCVYKYPVAVFFEPDISEHTALATVCDGSLFSSLRLAGGVMT